MWPWLSGQQPLSDVGRRQFTGNLDGIRLATARISWARSWAQGNTERASRWWRWETLGWAAWLRAHFRLPLAKRRPSHKSQAPFRDTQLSQWAVPLLSPGCHEHDRRKNGGASRSETRPLVSSKAPGVLNRPPCGPRFEPHRDEAWPVPLLDNGWILKPGRPDRCNPSGPFHHGRIAIGNLAPAPLTARCDARFPTPR